MKPSFILSAFDGILVLAGVLFVGHYISKNYEVMSSMELGKLLLMVSIAVGIHGLMHFWAEVYYGYNPLEGRWGYGFVPAQVAPQEVAPVQAPPPVPQRVPRPPMQQMPSQQMMMNEGFPSAYMN